MAFDFPNSPSMGQRVTGAGGVVYVWDGVKWASSVGNVTVQSMGDVGRNLLHNPLFNVAQRGAGSFTAVTTGWTYTLDRWANIIGAAGDTYGATQVAAADADRTGIGDEAVRYYLSNGFTGGAGAANTCLLSQFIEGVRRLAGKTVTISFWAIASAALKLGISIDQFFGTSGSPSAVVNGAGQSVTLSSAWTRYSLTFAVPSIVGKTLGTAGNDYTELLIWFSAGSNNATRSGSVGVQSGTVNMFGVQLEIGSQATPLEKPDPRYDLANCQRFFCTGTAYLAVQGAGTQTFGVAGQLPVTMRASPTVAMGTNSNSNFTTGGGGGLAGNASVYIYGTSGSTAPLTISQVFTASADL